jgi:hypothetical protein
MSLHLVTAVIRVSFNVCMNIDRQGYAAESNVKIWESVSIDGR